MTPNQSHVAGLELALDALQDANLWRGSAAVRKLIEQAKAAPAETDKGEAFCDGHCTWLDHQPGCPRAEPTEAVELLRAKFPRIDPCQPEPLDEKAHCCEYTLYVERERLHRFIDDQHKRLMANHSADDLNMVKVPRELLARIERYFGGFTCDDPVGVALGDDGLSKLRALLGGAG